MSEDKLEHMPESELKSLKIVLKVFGIGLTLFFVFFWLITILDSPLIAVGGSLDFLNWPPLVFS